MRNHTRTRLCSLSVFALPVLGCLLLAASSCSDKGTDPDHHHDPADGNCGHLVADGYRVVSEGNTVVSGWQGTQTGSIVAREGELGPAYHMTFFNADSTEFGVADNCDQNALRIEVGQPQIVEAVRDSGVQWTFRLRGLEAGTTTIVLRGMHEEHSHVSSEPIVVTVEEAETGGLALSGRVNLEVMLVSGVSKPLGSQSFPDENGIRVYLERPDGSLDSTLTDSGAFVFRGLGSGEHHVWSGPGVARSTILTHTLADTDADVGTIEVGPIGELTNPPNPFPYSHGTGIEFLLPAEERVLVRVFSPSASLVWSYEWNAVGEFQHVHWIGTDQGNNPLPPGPYWTAVRYNGAWHSRVVVKLPE